MVGVNLGRDCLTGIDTGGTINKCNARSDVGVGGIYDLGSFDMGGEDNDLDISAGGTNGVGCIHDLNGVGTGGIDNYRSVDLGGMNGIDAQGRSDMDNSEDGVGAGGSHAWGGVSDGGMDIIVSCSSDGMNGTGCVRDSVGPGVGDMGGASATWWSARPAFTVLASAWATTAGFARSARRSGMAYD